MKIQIVYDIAPNSTRDVADGLRDALRSLGHEVCGTPTHTYSLYLLDPLQEYDLDKIPKDKSALIWAAVNKLIVADTVIFQPEAVIVVSGWIMGRIIVEHMKRLGVFTALYCTESPYQDEEQSRHDAFNAYDVIFCNELSSMEYMQRHHDNVAYLPHSYNPEVHRPVSATAPEFDVFMCGTGFSERRSVLSAADFGEARVRLVGFWPGDNSSLPGIVSDGMVDNGELPAIYTNVPINLNIHRTTRTWLGGAPEEQHIEHAQSIGPRVFEVLACGGFLLTDHREEMNGFLVDGVHLATFADARELGDLVRHYLQHGDERARIAAAGRAAVADCTFGRRCEQYILPMLCKKGVTV